MKPEIRRNEMGWVDIRFEPLYFRRIFQMFYNTFDTASNNSPSSKTSVVYETLAPFAGFLPPLVIVYCNPVGVFSFGFLEWQNRRFYFRELLYILRRTLFLFQHQ
jgi:hypothetical protein